jgi:hypothetical protein
MKLYHLMAHATVSIYAEVEASSLENAIQDAVWTCEEVDGEPSNIEVLAEEEVE